MIWFAGLLAHKQAKLLAIGKTVVALVDYLTPMRNATGSIAAKKWLMNCPHLNEKGEVPILLQITLSPCDWASLTEMAAQTKTTVSEALHTVIDECDSVNCMETITGNSRGGVTRAVDVSLCLHEWGLLLSLARAHHWTVDSALSHVLTEGCAVDEYKYRKQPDGVQVSG